MEHGSANGLMNQAHSFVSRSSERNAKGFIEAPNAVYQTISIESHGEWHEKALGFNDKPILVLCRQPYCSTRRIYTFSPDKLAHCLTLHSMDRTWFRLVHPSMLSPSKNDDI